MTQQGWECPKCLNVYAPWVAQCSKCPGFQWTFTYGEGEATGHVCDFSVDLTVPQCLICGKSPEEGQLSSTSLS